MTDHRLGTENPSRVEARRVSNSNCQPRQERKSVMPQNNPQKPAEQVVYTYHGEAITNSQMSIIIELMTTHQVVAIPGLRWSVNGGSEHSIDIPQTPSWWHRVDPLDVWDEFSPGRMRYDMLPGWLYHMIGDEAYAMGTPAQALLASCMAAVIGAIDDRMQIRTIAGRDWLESARIWQGVVARSGAKKSPAFRAGLRPLLTVEKHYKQIDAANVASHAIAMKRYEKKVRDLETSEEAPVLDDLIRPDHPQTHRYVMHDVTVEALSEILRHQERGTMLVFDELARWMASLEGRGKAATDRALYLELYEGGHRSISRIGRGLNIEVPNWSASILGGIQPTVLKQTMKDVPIDGLLQRFYPYICNMPDRPSNEPRDDDAWERFDDVVKNVNGQMPGVVTLSDEAADIIAEAWDKLFDIARQPGIPEAMQSHLFKWEGGMYRWLLVLHCLVCSDDGAQAIGRAVSAETAEMVVSLHDDLFLPNVFALYQEVLGAGGHLDVVRWIAGHILANDIVEITVRDMYRASRDFKKMDDLEKRTVLRALEDNGWIQQQDPMDRSQVPSKWLVNPKVHFVFSVQATDERERRREIIRKIRG